MKTILTDPVLRRQTIGKGECGEQYHGDDATAAGNAENGDSIISFQKGRSHARQRPLAWCDQVWWRTDQPIQIGRVDGRREVIHLVIEQYARIAGDEGSAKKVVDGQRAGDSIALAIENGKVAGIAATAVAGSGGRKQIAGGGALGMNRLR